MNCIYNCTTNPSFTLRFGYINTTKSMAPCKHSTTNFSSAIITFRWFTLKLLYIFNPSGLRFSSANYYILMAIYSAFQYIQLRFSLCNLLYFDGIYFLKLCVSIHSTTQFFPLRFITFEGEFTMHFYLAKCNALYTHSNCLTMF
jgi:hypothetical protein